MTMLQHGLVPSTGGYQIERSLRFNSADSAYLNRTPASAGNRKTWTWSGWVKRSGLGTAQIFWSSGTSNLETAFYFVSTDKLSIYQFNYPSYEINLGTTQVFRDVGAWYHIVIAVDTTQATSSNRVKLYVNGVQVTAFDTSTYPTLDLLTATNNNVSHMIGRSVDATGYYFPGYLTEVNFIDGSALTPSSFGETDTDTGVWKPKAYSGSYGTNGFYLKFADNSGTTSTTLGKDSSGNGNNWTPNNFYVGPGTTNAEKAGIDSLVDTPTPYGTDTGAGGEVRGNYATLNPLDSDTITLSNGNLQGFGGSGGTGEVFSTSTIGMSSGKWYCEVLYAAKGSGSALNVGIIEAVTLRTTTQTYPDYGYYSNNGNKYNDLTSSSYGASWDVNDVIGISYDADAGTLVFYKNGSSQGTAFSGLSGTYFFCQARFGSDSHTTQWNFGQRPFAYTAPSGHKALCTQNLPTPTIGATSATQAGKYFNPVLYTGNGSTQSITGVGFQPDWVWIKGRSGATSHGLYDAVRGVQKQLESDDITSAETTETTGLTAFGTDGFTVGALAQLNTSSATYAAWNWKANGAGSSNTAGTISSTVSASTLSGFSIVTFTSPSGTGNFSAGHGLGVTPEFVIVKSRSAAGNWYVYHKSLATNNYLELNSTNAVQSATDQWGAGMTSSVIGLRASYSTVPSATTVAYCFAPVAGYSAFGSYTGNGSTDGPFIYTGFRPAWVMWKNSTSASQWILFDVKRWTYNIMNGYLEPNTSDAENTGSAASGVFDILSNGFKLRVTGTDYNQSGNTYVYAAFAEVPTKFSLAR